ncbi:NAD-dependent DNA ligase LigA [Patescibacteria group bacterium]|nr:NAD-dependent DNA ligase LigA [Patescibacteria group bacterium]
MIELSDPLLKNISPSNLGELLIKAKNAYYTSAKPIMDDHTYDTLEEILRHLNPHHRLFSKIGHKNFDTGWTKSGHDIPMGSQNKASSYVDLVHYFELKKIPANTNFVVQPKCDGISLEVKYKKGQTIEAVTRGDGKIGDSITQNVVLMKNFVPQLKLPFTGSVRFEIVVTYQDFAKLNQISSENYSNPRNAVAGISQRLDSLYSSFCSLLAVDIYSPNLKFQTELSQIEKLKTLGLTVVETQLCQNLSQVENIFQQFFTKKRAGYLYEIDGLVVKINPVSLQQKLGFKNGRPKFQVAYKFPAATTTTTVKSIAWQTGPLGTVTPVAMVEPVEISGAIITFASLANYQLLKQKNIAPKDIVQISRRGDVIPYIEKVISKINPHQIKIPTICPSCGHRLKKEDKFLRCPASLSCPAQTLGNLRLFCHFLDIKGISGKTIKKLVKARKITLPGDFYLLTVEDFINLDGLGKKSGQNIVHQIQAKRQLSLAQIFTAASVPNFSSKRVKQIIGAGFNTPQKILNLSLSQLESLPGFQITLAQKIIEGLALKKETIKSILAQVKIKKTTTTAKLAGLKFAITGDLSLPRHQIVEKIETAGGQVVNTLSRNTTYLICNQKNSSSTKFKLAQKLNIKIISETQLRQLLAI